MRAQLAGSLDCATHHATNNLSSLPELSSNLPHTLFRESDGWCAAGMLRFDFSAFAALPAEESISKSANLPAGPVERFEMVTKSSLSGQEVDGKV